MIQSNPIDIPCKKINRHKNTKVRLSTTVNAHFSKSVSYDSSSNIPLSGISLSSSASSKLSCSYEESKKIIIEIQSPIHSYDTMAMFLQDAFPVLSVDDVDYIIHRLDKVKIAKIQCNNLTAAEDACNKLVENGLTAWIE
ncbi:MAG: hypothetical protein EBU66_18865 [Bacteroidetes bacterium]|nr:hypothetical protein [bacterium]NBP66695.1 hypothetical protein [Bacteroidota bacterium]